LQKIKFQFKNARENYEYINKIMLGISNNYHFWNIWNNLVHADSVICLNENGKIHKTKEAEFKKIQQDM